ncbi:hypothetical protein LEP3755_03620 [Leptolyngbya sp. NIES-3755]|nr:hypothetical protein LEP3755_03620 [Leptolyngbya sp. NIES-3755]
MAKEYRKQIEAMVRSLSAMETITVTTAEIAPPATSAQLDTARWMAQLKLPTGLEAFYKEMNGVTVEWEAKEAFSDQEVDRGSIQLLPVEQIFGNWEGTTWFEDIPDSERFRGVKPFDLFQPEACAAFYQQLDAAPEDTVYFHYFGEELSAMSYQFEEYLERLVACRGYLYWQLTLCSESQNTPEVERVRSRIPVLFPECSLDQFVPR